jgi:hypothetical protein
VVAVPRQPVCGVQDYLESCLESTRKGRTIRSVLPNNRATVNAGKRMVQAIKFREKRIRWFQRSFPGILCVVLPVGVLVVRFVARVLTERLPEMGPGFGPHELHPP